MKLFISWKPVQLGDVAILDISAATIEQDESTGKSIPSAESKGLFQFLSVILYIETHKHIPTHIFHRWFFVSWSAYAETAEFWFTIE